MEQENKQILEKEPEINDKYVKNTIDLDLGDIIEIVSPQNSEYHETTNYIGDNSFDEFLKDVSFKCSRDEALRISKKNSETIEF